MSASNQKNTNRARGKFAAEGSKPESGPKAKRPKRKAVLVPNSNKSEIENGEAKIACMKSFRPER